MTISADGLVAVARTRVGRIEAHDLDRARGAGDVVIVDVRDGAERATKPSIPGSVHASRGMLEFYLDPNGDMHLPALKPGARFVFVCGSGGRASLAAATAKDFGLGDVAYLDGGMRAWIEAGLPVES